VQVASLELKLKVCLVRIMLDFSKLQLFHFLVSCTSLYFCIPFSGWPRDSDFFSYRRTHACPYHFISFLLEIECHFLFFLLSFDNFFQLKVFLLPGCFLFDRAIPQSSMVAQAAPISDPFRTLPALPQMSIGQVGTTPSVQYGISNMHVNDVSWF